MILPSRPAVTKQIGVRLHAYLGALATPGRIAS